MKENPVSFAGISANIFFFFTHVSECLTPLRTLNQRSQKSNKCSWLAYRIFPCRNPFLMIFKMSTVADPRGALPARCAPSPPMDQNFLNFMQFFDKSGNLYAGAHLLEGWRPRGILDPPLVNRIVHSIVQN